jgi:hypothetical protein
LLCSRDLEVPLLNRDARHKGFDLDLLVTSTGFRWFLLQKT